MYQLAIFRSQLSSLDDNCHSGYYIPATTDSTHNDVSSIRGNLYSEIQVPVIILILVSIRPHCVVVPILPLLIHMHRCLSVLNIFGRNKSYPTLPASIVGPHMCIALDRDWPDMVVNPANVLDLNIALAIRVRGDVYGSIDGMFRCS